MIRNNPGANTRRKIRRLNRIIKRLNKAVQFNDVHIEVLLNDPNTPIIMHEVQKKLNIKKEIVVAAFKDLLDRGYLKRNKGV